MNLDLLEGGYLMKKIILRDVCGEYCTERTHPKITFLRDETERAIKVRDMLVIDRTGIKILSISFIDEWLPSLAIKHSRQELDKWLTFDPPLEHFYIEQIDRGMRLRKGLSASP